MEVGQEHEVKSGFKNPAFVLVVVSQTALFKMKTRIVNTMLIFIIYWFFYYRTVTTYYTASLPSVPITFQDQVMGPKSARSGFSNIRSPLRTRFIFLLLPVNFLGQL
jgi:hypothetical protein